MWLVSNQVVFEIITFELLEEELEAIGDLGKVVVENAKLALDAEKFLSEFGARPAPKMPEMLVNNKAE